LLPAVAVDPKVSANVSTHPLLVVPRLNGVPAELVVMFSMQLMVIDEHEPLWRFLARRSLDHGRAERRHHRRWKVRKNRARVPLQGYLDPAFQAAVQPGGLCPGEERDFRQRLAQDRTGQRNPRDHEPRRITINGASTPDNVQQIETKAA
jgi:hypothetical protein